MGLLDHKELRIVQGVYKIQGDTRSAESNINPLDLLNNFGGISLQSWSPNLPSLESSGVWADSPLMSGRQPLVMSEGNVTESMRIVINGGSMLGTAKKLAELGMLIQAARNFWTELGQINPVYLHWFASCGAGKQYALIYNMDFKPEYGDSTSAVITGTLVIEREPFWRFIPPGANPQQWRCEYHNQAFDTTKTDISTSGTFLVSPPVNASNCSEYNSSYQLLTDNSVTIPAAMIPGDAPALLMLTVSSGAVGDNEWGMISKKAVRIQEYISNNAVAQNNIMNASDGYYTGAVDNSLVNDTGASRAVGAATAQRLRISFATDAINLRGTFITKGKNQFIGRYAVFMRCRQINGAAGDVTMYLRYGESVTAITDGIKMNTVSPQLIAGTGNTTSWGLTYMGVATLPPDSRKAIVNSATSVTSGFGLDNNNSNGGYNFALFAASAAGTQELYVNDLILMPIDEGSITLQTTDTPHTNYFYDETGYLSHGIPDPFISNASILQGSSTVQLAQMTGPGIQLTPNVDNKLYTLAFGSDMQSSISNYLGLYISIIPRCRGIRTYSNLAGASASG